MIVVASVLLGAVFLVSGVAKFAAPVRWRAQSGELGVPVAITTIVPFVELVVGALLVAQIARRAVAIA
ncbi:MAG TPA: MauE/DoxX family redox-associated membrane protein, partial [Ilumatobacteraceae bacterium]